MEHSTAYARRALELAVSSGGQSSPHVRFAPKATNRSSSCDRSRSAMRRHMQCSNSTAIGGSDHLCPLLGFFGDELAKVGGREREHVATQIGEPRLDLMIGKSGVYLLVELLDDLGWRGLRCADAGPGARLVARHTFPDSRDIGQHLRTTRGGHCEGAQLAGPDVFD